MPKTKSVPRPLTVTGRPVMARKVRTADDFFKALTAAVKEGKYKFALHPVPRTRKARRGGYSVPMHQLYWEAPQQSLWAPDTVVAMHYYLPKGHLLGTTAAAQCIGLPLDVWEPICAASFDYYRHDRSLRARLLAACRVREVPDHKRRRVV